MSEAIIRSEGILSGSIVSEGTLRGSLLMPIGYEDYSGPYAVTPKTEKAKLIAANIKQGITILGVTGTLEPSSSVKVHAKSVTPKTTSQTVLPGEGHDYLSQVDVAAIPYVETDNSAGGKTVTIAGEG